MRVAYLFLIAAAPLCGGCSCLIASAGQDLGRLTTRDEVRAEMGEPAKSGVEDGKPFDEYHTRRKISLVGTTRMNSLGMAIGMTFGASEIVAFPWEVCATGSRTLLGQDIRFIYDPEGNVVDWLLDGERFFLFPHGRRRYGDAQAVEQPVPHRTPPAPALPATLSGASPAAP